MIYQMEELLPAAAALAEKYTSGESSSVTYETAQMLMEAVIYCIEEWERSLGNALVAKDLPPAQEACKAGYEQVVKKVRKARKTYHRILKGFQDYGCENYRDTLQKGIPAFFIHYDARFRPQDHILTLDYPLIRDYGQQNGIDRICRYLSGIAVEKELLECFPAEGIRRLLEETEDTYGTGYMGNLCDLVLTRAIGCVAADRPVYQLELEEKGQEELQLYFSGDHLPKIQRKICLFLEIILNRCELAHLSSYFEDFGKDLAVRIFHGTI
ncbi:MAG: DUF6179 domain-containing protein [Blautia sp.]|jgi:hypothetical protein